MTSNHSGTLAQDTATVRARAERLAGRQIALDDLAENLARAVVELREAYLRLADGHVLRHAGSYSFKPDQNCPSGRANSSICHAF